LEAPGQGEVVAQVGENGLVDGVQRLLAGAAAAHGGDAEDRAAGLPGAVHVAAFVLRLDVDGGLLEVDPEAAEMLDPAADVALEAVFKGPAVLALEDYLAQLQKKDFVHGINSFVWYVALW